MSKTLRSSLISKKKFLTLTSCLFGGCQRDMVQRQLLRKWILPLEPKQILAAKCFWGNLSEAMHLPHVFAWLIFGGKSFLDYVLGSLAICFALLYWLHAKHREERYMGGAVESGQPLSQALKRSRMGGRASLGTALAPPTPLELMRKGCTSFSQGCTGARAIAARDPDDGGRATGA